MEWGYAREAELRKQATGAASGTLQDAIDRYIKEVCPLHAAGDNEAKRLKALAAVAELLPVSWTPR